MHKFSQQEISLRIIRNGSKGLSHDLGLQAVNSRKTTVLGFIGFNNRTLVDRVRKEKEMQIKAKRSDMVLGDKKSCNSQI